MDLFSVVLEHEREKSIKVYNLDNILGGFFVELYIFTFLSFFNLKFTTELF